MKKLKDAFGKEGLEILAFPCNQFARQEPGTNDEICQFVERKNADVMLFDKVDVNGDKTHPIFDFLKKELKGVVNTEFIKWNFTKFLIDRDGTPVKRYSPNETFDSIAPDIENLLRSKRPTPTPA
jgi:glutathione peroxidase